MLNPLVMCLKHWLLGPILYYENEIPIKKDSLQLTGLDVSQRCQNIEKVKAIATFLFTSKYTKNTSLVLDGMIR